MALIHESLLPVAERKAFVAKVEQISKTLQINPNWLMQLMYAESRINPRAKNPYGGAVGLIQFMPATATYLGTSAGAIFNMTAIQQLDYVLKYFRPYVGKLTDYYQLYLVTFWPAGIGKDDDYVFQSAKLSASLIATQNPAINLDKDGKITIREFKEYVRKTVPKSYINAVFR